MRNLLLALIVFLTPALQAQENSQQVFVDALTQALNTKDKEAFYRLVCFDGMDEEWKKMGLKGFDSMFTWLEAGRKFSIATESPDPEKIKAREYKGGQIVYNLEVTSACVIQWEDTDQLKNTKVSLMLGQKEGKMLISCYVPKK